MWFWPLIQRSSRSFDFKNVRPIDPGNFEVLFVPSAIL